MIVNKSDALDGTTIRHHADLAKLERQITIKTCGALYAKRRSHRRLYRKAARAGGIQLNVKYIDTSAAPSMDHNHDDDHQENVKVPVGSTNNQPIVLAVHGAPGSYQDFGFLIDQLRAQSVRVIAPNFPVIRETERTIFRHSADEKAAYLTDFLRAIQVDQIDLLIAHSSAVFPALLMLSERLINIRSLALFNPPGHRLPHSMKPTWFKCGSVKLYQNKFGRAMVRVCGPQFLRIVGAPVKIDNMDNVMLTATVMKYSGCKRVVGHLHYLSKIKLPTLLLFSENDKLIEKEIFYEMTHMLNVCPSKFDYYDADGKLERSGSTESDWIRVIVFKAGGHYSYLNYGSIVGQAVTQLIDQVTEPLLPEPPTNCHSDHYDHATLNEDSEQLSPASAEEAAATITTTAKQLNEIQPDQLDKPKMLFMNPMAQLTSQLQLYA